MSKKRIKIGIASAAVIGAGAAVLQAKTKSEAKKAAETTTVTSEAKNDYRNTERGKYEKKNSKGIYYTNGNYEAFLQDRKNRKASMTKEHTLSEAALQPSQQRASLSETVRGCRVPIFIFLEAMDVAGGACDGIF